METCVDGVRKSWNVIEYAIDIPVTDYFWQSKNKWSAKSDKSSILEMIPHLKMNMDI